MAKETVKVDNGLEEIKLENREINDKKNKKKTAKEKIKNDTKKLGYFGKVKLEMSKVTWPTKKNVAKYSFATIIMIICLAIFFIGISALFDLLYALVQGWIG